MKKTLTLTLLLLCSLFTWASNDSIANFKTSSQDATIQFMELRTGYPTSDDATIYYRAWNLKGKDLSHFNLGVEKCVKFKSGGLYSHPDTLKSSSCFGIGKDGSDKTDYMYGIKYDCSLNKGDTINFFIILTGNYEMEPSTAKIKYGTTFSSATLLLPECKSLPVKLLYFRNETIRNTAIFSWATASEINNIGFYLQYSNDNMNFTNISFTESAHNSTMNQNYSYVTNKYESGYYRLMILDYDGYKEYSETLYLDKFVYSIYPLPVTSILNVGESKEVKLYDLAGTLISDIEISNGICDFSNIENGLYIISVDGVNLKFIKK